MSTVAIYPFLFIIVPVDSPRDSFSFQKMTCNVFPILFYSTMAFFVTPTASGPDNSTIKYCCFFFYTLISYTEDQRPQQTIRNRQYRSSSKNKQDSGNPPGSHHFSTANSKSFRDDSQTTSTLRFALLSVRLGNLLLHVLVLVLFGGLQRFQLPVSLVRSEDPVHVRECR